jgi:hypothetical protein
MPEQKKQVRPPGGFWGIRNGKKECNVTGSKEMRFQGEILHEKRANKS